MKPRVFVTADEMATLIRESGGRSLDLEFGPAGTWLKQREDGMPISGWALGLLASARGIASGVLVRSLPRLLAKKWLQGGAS
jgi:hypothetical protein